MRINKFLMGVLIFSISMPVFIWLETGFAVKTWYDLVKPLIFSISLVVSLANLFKIYLLSISLSLLFLMVLFYLFWQIPVSDWFGSVGVGILITYFLGNIPQLIKRGYLEKL